MAAILDGPLFRRQQRRTGKKEGDPDAIPTPGEQSIESRGRQGGTIQAAARTYRGTPRGGIQWVRALIDLLFWLHGASPGPTVALDKEASGNPGSHCIASILHMERSGGSQISQHFRFAGDGRPAGCNHSLRRISSLLRCEGSALSAQEGCAGGRFFCGAFLWWLDVVGSYL